jgi:hypothetical protein
LLRLWTPTIYQLFFCVFAGPNLPKATSGAAMVPTPDGTGVVNIGGYPFNPFNLYELKCTSVGCQWSLMAQHLSIGRIGHIAINVPDSFADCEH